MCRILNAGLEDPQKQIIFKRDFYTLLEKASHLRAEMIKKE